MATYYRWRKSTIQASETVTDQGAAGTQIKRFASETVYIKLATAKTQGGYSLSNQQIISNKTANVHPSFRYDFSIVSGSGSTLSYVYGFSATNDEPRIGGHISGGYTTIRSDAFTSWKEYLNSPGPGTSQGYVYSTSSSAYPNGGVSGDYYYDQRTTVTSPTAPTRLTYPNPITTLSVDVSWTAATSNVPNYTVSLYEVSYSTNNGDSWTVAGTTAETSYSFNIPAGTLSIMFRVRAKDSNGRWGSYVTGTESQVILAPTLTVPQMVMQGQQATINWTAIEGADSYTLQRKSSADTDWTQVYSGVNLSYTETVGTWTSLQYRVQAVFDGTPGGWATSDSIQIVSASALVISGQDGDLGTLTSDVPYSISSDQTSPTIDVTVEVNGGEYASFQATSGQTYNVSVLDLPTGTGNITITATTEVSSSPVTVTRNWTYSKTAQTFPNSGSVAALTKEGNVVYPETLPEAVRTPMNPWGGNLGTALNHLKNAALFNRTKQPKYSEVTIDLSTLTQTDAQNGKIINLPYKGAMTPHRVVHIGNPDSDLYDSSCNGVWLLREDIVELGDWQVTNVNTGFPNSTIANAMDGYFNNYDISVQASIKSANIPYCVGGGSLDVTTTTKKIFPASMKELGADVGTNNYPEDGAPLQYFITHPDALVANFNNTPTEYWSRSPDDRFSTWVYSINKVGGVGGDSAGNARGYRYLFIMDPTFTATYYVDPNGGIHDQQEYTEAGNWLDMWGNAIPAVKIETGSYVGTGTSRSSNPNTLTFSFKPHVVFIAGMSNSNPGTGGDNNVEVGLFFPDILQEAYKASSYFLIGSSVSQYYCAKFEDATNTLSWYHDVTGASSQLNYSGKTYFYVAIG